MRATGLHGTQAGRGRHAWAIYALSGVPAAAACAFAPEPVRAVLSPLLSLSSAIAIGTGLRLNPSAPRLPWVLLVAGMGAFTIADLVWYLGLGGADTIPSVADIFYLAGYPFFAAGLTLLVACRRGRSKHEGLIDGAMVATAFTAIVWAFMVDPLVDSHALGASELVVSMAYPVGDILVIALAASLLASGGWGNRSLRLLTWSLALLLVGDGLYYAGVASQGSAFGGDFVFAMWPASYVLMGAAALHRSVAATGERSATDLRHTRARLAVLVGLTLSGPLLAVVRRGSGPEDVIVGVCLSALMALLVIGRLAGLVRVVERGAEDLEGEGVQLRDELTIRERDAAEARALFEELVTTVPSAFFKIRLADLAVLYVSPYVEELTGFSPQEMQGMEHAMARIRPEDRQDVALALARLQQGWQEVQFEFAFQHKDGYYRWIGGSASVSRDEVGEVRMCTGYLFDLTARRDAMRMVEESERRFRELTENLDQIFFVMSADGDQMLYVSPALTRMTGHSTESLYEDPRSWFLMVVEEDRESLLQTIASNPDWYRTEVRIRAKDGSIRWVSVSVRAVQDDNRIVYRRVGVVEDITDRKLALEELQQSEAKVRLARDQAIRASRAKDEFLSRMSHELRTPLNSILGFAQLLEMDELTEEQTEEVRRILVAGRHLLSLINAVLDIARIESGKMSLSLEPVGVEGVVTESVSLILLQAHARSLDVTWNVDPDVQVAADVQRLKQVMLNLLSNAVKYNATGGSVEVSGERRGSTYRISVADTGPGIPEDKLERLFVPFDRLGAEMGSVEGTGLGLALSKELVKAMEGTLGVQTELGAGSTFFVELPLAAGAPEPEDLEPHQATSPAGPGEPRRGDVLYIEDNDSNLALMRKVFARRPGIVLRTAIDGRTGLEAAAERAPDLILLDLHLPDMEGIDVLRRLDREPAGRRIPVVVVSADATPSQIKRLQAAGADGYLTKPFRVDELLGVVDRWVMQAVGG